MTNTRRLAPLPLMLIALAALAVLVLIPWVVQAQAQEVTPTRDATGGTPPAQPTTLQASAEHDSVTLTWTASTDQTVTHYAILRRNRDTDALGVFHVIDSNAGPGTSYTDSSVAAASRYGYRAKAVSPTGVSQWSGFVKADTPAAPDPTPTPTPTPEPTPTPGLTPATLESTLLGYSEEEGAGTLEPNEVTFDEGATFRVTSVNTWPGVPGLVLMLTAGSSAQDAALADRDFILEADETVLVVGTTEFSFDDATLSHSDTTGDNAEYTGVVLATWTEGEPGLAAGETVTFRLERRDRPEEAQFTTHNTKRILVSNTAQGNDDQVETSGNDHAQLFQTAGATNGYTLTSVIVVSEDAEGDGFDVEVCEADGTSDDFPTTTCTVLTTPQAFPAGSLEFTHPGILLDANTNYVVVIKQDSGSVTLDSTTAAGEDVTGLTGWTIKDKFDRKSSGAWQQKSGGNEAIQITVKGYETPANQDATGAPRVLRSAESAGILVADTSGIADGNGFPTVPGPLIRVDWSYQWIRIDGDTSTETNIGVDSPSYQPVDADIGNLVKVQVSFEDGGGNSETVTSLPFGPIAQPAGPSQPPSTLVGNTGQSPSATAMITGQYAMGFRLGTHGQGYEISSVSIDLAAAPSSLTVSLWIAGHPELTHGETRAYKLFDFENPSSFQTGLNMFTAPAGAFAYQNVNHFIVLSGFGASLSIKETTSDNEDAGGETGAILFDTAGGDSSVLRLALEGSRRDSGILAATYAQSFDDDQEIISLGDLWTVGITVGAADRYLIRGFSWLSDNATSAYGGMGNPMGLWNESSGALGTKRFRLHKIRNNAGLNGWTAPQGATVEGSASYFFGQDARGSFTRVDSILTRTWGIDPAGNDAPTAPGVTLFDGPGDASIGPHDIPFMAVLGEPLHAMVQNLGQADNSFHAVGGVVPVLSQGFTTSPNAAGYRLQGIGVNIEGSDSVVGVAQVPDDAASVSVAVYSADADGKPAAKLFDLLSPTEYAPGHSFFEAPAGTTLAASTSYVVVWSHLGGTWHRLQQTSSDSEDAGAFAGFSIADAFYRGANLANLAADSGGNALEIAVYGNAITPLKRVTGFDFHNSNSAAKGIWGNDDTFWVANDGAGTVAADKLYAYNRSDGSRDTGSDFDNLNTAGNNDARGICSDGTTMFVADSGDNKVYAYKMSDTTRDSSKDVTLDADNGSAHGLSCDSTHLWVANDTSSHLISKIFVYLRSDGSHASTLDIGAGTLSPSNTDGTINNHRPSGMWSNGTTLFVADHVDEKIYAYQLADRTRDDDKNLSLDTDNADPEGLWFDGRVLWVVDSSDVQLYAYDLPGAQPGNTAAAGVPTLDATAQQHIELTADISGITDSTDGLDNVLYLYQWIRVDGADETELAGETGPSYTPTADDVGKNLKVRVIFDDAAGNQEYPRYSPEIGPVNALTVPDAPTMLTAEPAPDTTPQLAFDLSWTAPASDGGSAVTKHQGRFKTGSNAFGPWTNIPDSAATEANATSYTVSGLTANNPPTTFTFEVQAVNANGDSGPSNQATATVDVPDQIATIGTTPSDGQIALIWDPPANNGSAILRYQYFVLNADTNIHLISRWTNIPGSNAATVAYTVTGLTNGVPYNFGVRPVNSVGPGPGKSRENLIPATFPTAPTNLMAEPHNGKVRLEWTAPTFNGGITINYYEYQQKAGTNAFGPWLRIIGSSASTTGYTVISLTNGTSYTFKVRARNDIDAGTASNEATATPANFPDPPPTVTATAGNQQITVNWTTPADNGNTILRYQYNVYDTTNEMTHTTWTNIPGSDVNTTEYTVTSLTNGVAYAIGIRAVNDFGPGPGTLSPVLIPASIPGAPTGLTAEPGDGQVHLQWTAPISDGGNTITGYEYQQKTGSTPFGSGINISGSNANTTEHTVTGLTNGTNYTFRVRAKNPMGEGLPSNEASATPVTVPSVPQNFTLTPGNGQVRLDWTAPASDGGNAILRYEYRHRAGTDSFTTWTNVLGSNINTTQYTVTGLTNGTLHTFEIRAATATTKGMAASETTTPMAVAPDAPRELSAKSKNTAVELTWQTPLDNGGSPIIRYEYRQKTGNGPFGTWMNIPNSGVTGLNATSYTVTGLTNGTSYHFKLRAVNNADESAASNEALGIPQPITTPDKPRGGQLSPGEGKVIVQWIEPLRDGGTPILHYEYCLRQKSQCNGHWVEIPDSAPGGDNHGLYEITRSNGTFTRVYLRAVNDQGAGHSFDYSAVPLAGAPAAPTNLRAEAPSSEYVKISWNEPRARSGATIIGYSLEYSRDGVTWARDPYCQFPYCDQQYLGHGRHPRGTNSIMTRIGEDATLYYRIRTLFHTNTPTIVNDIDFSRGASPSSPIITVTTVGATGILALPTIGVTGGHGREGANDVIVFDLWITGHQQRTTPVTVIYRTVDLRARAGSDYITRSGLLTFAPTDTEKTVSVPIIDDAVEDSGEEFILRLSNASGALIARAGAFGTITNTEESLTGFTLVNAATETDIGGVGDGDTVTLDDPADRQYGIRVETMPDTGVNSVRLELSGAKTVTRTDNEAPYTLYAEGGEGLPPGAYTLQATAYPEANRGGNALQSISVSFTVAEATEEPEDEPSLTATFPVSPFQSTRHRGGDDRPQVIATFSLPVKPFEKTTPSVSLTGATVRSVSQHQEEGLENAWIFFLDPEDNEDIVFTLAAGQSCDAGGICTQDGAMLYQGAATTLPGPQPEQEEQNTQATGVPTISGTPEVGQTLTAGTAGIADEDGLTKVSYTYQWTAGGSDIDGATGSSYTLTSSEQGQTVQVRVTFTDDADNAESLTSEATETVVQAPSPLTVSLENAATTHNGTDVFTFEIRFSEQFGLSYKTLRDDAFTVVGGEVKKAQRMDRDTPNTWWRITVEPDGNGDVTITLPATTDCTDDGAICTEDGRKLSNRLEFTVSGPGG